VTITPPAPIEDEALGMSQRWFTPLSNPCRIGYSPRPPRQVTFTTHVMTWTRRYLDHLASLRRTAPRSTPEHALRAQAAQLADADLAQIKNSNQNHTVRP
jgi:hypothetical protein